MKLLVGVRLTVACAATLMISSLTVIAAPAGAALSKADSPTASFLLNHRLAHSGANAPGAPTGVSVTLDATSAVVTWTAPTFVAGYPILGYVVTASPGAQTCTVAAASDTVAGTTTASCTVPGLTDGTPVSFSVVAISAGGTGPASTSSGSVTPATAASDVTLSAWPAAPENLGTQVTFTTFLNVGNGGTVEFDLGGTAIAGCAHEAVTSGYASCTTPSLVAGANSVTAVYSGDTNFSGATSNVVDYTISSSTLSAPPILTITSLTGPYNSSLTLTTSGGSGSGAITYSATDGTATGCSIAGAVLSVSEPGTCLVTASQASSGTVLGQSSNVTTVTMFSSYAAAWAVTGTYRDCAYGGTLPDCTSTSAATPTTTYSCPSGGTLSGSTCVQTYAATASHTCPSGGSYNASWNECEVFPGMSQSQCTQSGYSWYASGGYCYYFLAAATSYSCPQGGSLSGQSCVLSTAATPSTTYSCPSGETLSGSSCITSYGWVTLDSYGWVCTLGGSLSSSTCLLSGGSGPAEVPGAPTSVIADSADGSATVKWIAPASVGSSSIVSYTATAIDATNVSRGGQTCQTTTSQACTMTGLTNGDSYTFTVVATNVVGNSVASAPSNPVGPGAAPSAPTGLTLGTASAYSGVMNAFPSSSYWPLEDAAGSSTVSDASGNANTASVNGSVTLGSPGPLATDGLAITFAGSAYLSTATQVDNPQSTSMSVWFKTTGSGSIMGFSDTQNPTLTSNFDRSLWVDPTGHLVGGIYNTSAGTTEEVVSSMVVNDGAWHFAVFSFGPDGENLYVDGVLAGSNSAGTTAQVYNGWWSIGYQHTTYWPDRPTSDYFTGSLAAVGITPSVLSLSQVQSLYTTALSSATLSWSASAYNGSPVTRYTVTAHYVSGGVSPTTDVTACTTSGATSCIPSGLTAGDTYDFSVSATNAVATSSDSVATADYSVPGAPGAPTNVVVGTSAISAVGALVQTQGLGISTLSVSPQNAGDALVLSVGVFTTGITVSSVSGGGATWQRLTNTGSSADVELWLGTVTSTGPASISLTYSSASVASHYVDLDVQEYTNGTGPLTTWSSDVVGSTNNSSSTTSVVFPTLTPSATHELYVGFGSLDNSGSAGSSSGFTYLTNSWGNLYIYDPDVSSVVSPTGVQSPAGVFDAVGALLIASGVSQAMVSWTAPASNGGSTITGYSVSATDTTTRANGGETCATTVALDCTVTGLTNGDSYTFTVVATNAVGNSAPSPASNAVTIGSPASVPSAPTALVASPTNLIADPTLASAPSSWPQSYQANLGSANGDFNIANSGTNTAAFIYYGNGDTGSYGYIGSQTIAVVPGQTYNYSALINATAATAGNPGFFIYTPSYTWEGGLYQSPGTSGYMVGTWTAPAGVTQIFVEANLDGSTITPGSTISWSNFFFAPNGTTSLSWTASAPNGSPVTQYTVTGHYISGGVTPTTDATVCTTTGATSCSPSGLTSGDIYDFTVTATNASGNSAASTTSGTVIGP